MTVEKDLQKALAAAESAKGTYATFALSTDDPSAEQMFQQMSQDMDQHVSNIEDRLSSMAATQSNTGSASSLISNSSSASITNQQD